MLQLPANLADLWLLCVSQISNDYPILQTSAVNGTTQVFAIPVELAQRIIGPTRRLLAPSGLPRGFLKDGDTLAYTTLLYQTDIRQRIGIDLRVPFLSTQTFAIPFVDASGDGRTPFSFEINHVSQIIPSLGATIQGHRDVLANFDPTDRVSMLRATLCDLVAHAASSTRRLTTRTETTASRGV